MQGLHRQIVLLTTVLLGVLTTEAAETDERTIEDTYKVWVEATNEKNISKWSSFLATDPFFPLLICRH